MGQGFVERYYEDFEVGETYESVGRTITEADIVLHAGQTGDFYPHHMDKVWCAEQPFGRRIAHGTLIFSVGVGQTAGNINPRAISYGYDKLRFKRPVHISDTIRTRATITEKRYHHRRSDVGFVVELTEVLNQANEIVLSCEHLHLVEKRND